MIRRPPRSTLSSSSAASDVYKRQIRASQKPSRWSPLFDWMSLNKWLNYNWWRRLGKRLLFNDIQSERGNQRDGFWLARMNLATHSSRWNTVGFWFSSRANSGPFKWIFDWKVREESWIFWPLCCEVWKRSDAILGGKIAPALERFQNKDSPLPSIIWNSQRRTQIHSKSLKKPLLRQKDDYTPQAR